MNEKDIVCSDDRAGRHERGRWHPNWRVTEMALSLKDRRTIHEETTLTTRGIFAEGLIMYAAAPPLHPV